MPLTGEHFQMLATGHLFTAESPGRTLSRYGLLGADLGYPVVYPDKILFLYGDSLGVFRAPRRPGRLFLAKGSGAGDSIGYIPNMDFSQCHAIADFAAQVAKGNRKPELDAAGCPVLKVFENPDPTPGEPRYQQTSIRGLESGEGVGSFETPTGGFDLNGRLYMFYVVKVQKVKPYLALKSILARSTEPVSEWGERKPPMFERVTTISEHAPVADPATLKDEPEGTGKFLLDPVAVMDASAIRAAGFAAGLPAELKEAAKVIFVFGSGFRYNRSNLYLAAFAAADAEAGPEKWHYYTGRKGAEWSGDERMAAPLLDGEPNIGDHSVLWNPALHRFVLMYGHILARLSATPWGPWTAAVRVFGPDDPWAMKMVHRPGEDPIQRSIDPVFRFETNEPNDWKDQRGIPYGPMLIDKFTSGAGGAVTLYFTMSTWNPYEVFLMKTVFAAK